MKRILLSGIFLLELTALAITGFALPANATVAQPGPSLQSHALTNGYMPTGFDDNDNVQITVEGVFQDTCFKVGPTEATVSGNRILVKQLAYRYFGGCLDVLVPFYQTVSVGILRSGVYSIVDAVTGKTLGSLPIAQAQTASPDDFLYAPISDAVLTQEAGIAKVNLTGGFTNSCMYFKDIKYRVRGNVIEVLPITERMDTGNCKPGYYPFQQTATLGHVNAGRYLLHVRSLEGQAINKLVNIY